MIESSDRPTGGTLPVEVLKVTPSGPVTELLLPALGGTRSAPFRTSYWYLRPGEWSNWDQHDAVELWLVAEGSGTVWREEEPTAVQPGQAVFMPSRVRHRLHNDGTETMALFSIWWTVEPEVARS